jgi:hypothetical protein
MFLKFLIQYTLILQQISALPTSASCSTSASTGNNMPVVTSDGGATRAADSGSGYSTIKFLTNKSYQTSSNVILLHSHCR